MRAKSIWHLTVLSLLALPAYGYTDPGSGLLLWQILGAMCFGLMFYARKVLTYIWRTKREGRKPDKCGREPGLDGRA